ncbi:MAG: DUF72 domain-containing protein [Chloroflexota bacterium]|nr:MAG: DUF72 domain-containing protein [Chloroflexota bacterium]
MGDVLTGTASWTDPTLLATDWYPSEVRTAEDRLKHYASVFSLVEVDSTYYSLPAERSAVLWAERTPDHFIFDIKAFRLFTGHPTPVGKLPKRLREMLPVDLGKRSSLYSKDVPQKVVDEAWGMFHSALQPLYRAGKLGAVFLQFPKWFYFSRENLDRLEQARVRLGDYPMAVEFRQRSWMDDRHADKTLAFLKEHGIAYTCVDEPQGTTASVPPVAVATSDLAVVRFHGRRQETWDKPGVGVQERFRYLYDEAELSEWVPKLRALSKETRQVHALMNNCYADYGVRNAQQLEDLVRQASIPVHVSG